MGAVGQHVVLRWHCNGRHKVDSRIRFPTLLNLTLPSIIDATQTKPRRERERPLVCAGQITTRRGLPWPG